MLFQKISHALLYICSISSMKKLYGGYSCHRIVGHTAHHKHGGSFSGNGSGQLGHVQVFIGKSGIIPPSQRFNVIIIRDRKSTRLNSSHVKISYAVFCLKKKKNNKVN